MDRHDANDHFEDATLQCPWFAFALIALTFLYLGSRRGLGYEFLIRLPRPSI